MNRFRIHAKSWALFSVVMLLLCVLQSNFWWQMAGYTPSPQLWLNLVLYIVLFRGFSEALLLNYFLALIVAPFTAQRLGIIWLEMLVLTVAIFYLRKRVFWPGTRYFIIASVVVTVLHHLTSTLLSHWFDPHPVGFLVMDRIGETILTPISAAPVYWLLTYLDRRFELNLSPEQGPPIT